MAYDFPNSPTVGQQVVTSAGVVYTWDGVAWRPASTGGTPYAPLNSPIFTGDARAVTPAYGDSDTSVATSAFVQAAVSPTYDNVGRNVCHNPCFLIAQRGSGPWTTNGAYTADRWLGQANTDTFSWTRVALSDADRTAIGDEAATWCMQNVFTGNAAAAAYTEFEQRLEDIRRFSNKTITMSFWAKAASGTPRIGNNFYFNFGTGGSPSAPGVVSPTGNSVTISTTWARYSMTMAIPSNAGKTLGTNNDNFMSAQVWLSSGATNNASAGNIGVQSGTIQLWGMQLEINNVATPLDYGGSIQQVLAQCQRFYLTQAVLFGGYSAASGTNQWSTVSFPVRMRATPTIVVGTTSNGLMALNGARVDGAIMQLTVTGAGQFWDGATITASADL